jgi:hypothetical protein
VDEVRRRTHEPEVRPHSSLCLRRQVPRPEGAERHQEPIDQRGSDKRPVHRATPSVLRCLLPIVSPVSAVPEMGHEIVPDVIQGPRVRSEVEGLLGVGMSRRAPITQTGTPREARKSTTQPEAIRCLQPFHATSGLLQRARRATHIRAFPQDRLTTVLGNARRVGPAADLAGREADICPANWPAAALESNRLAKQRTIRSTSRPR